MVLGRGSIFVALLAWLTGAIQMQRNSQLCLVILAAVSSTAQGLEGELGSKSTQRPTRQQVAVSEKAAQACLGVLNGPDGENLDEALKRLHADGSAHCKKTIKRGSPLGNYVAAVGGWLKASQYQVPLSLASVFLGLASAWDGQAVLSVVLPIFAAVAAASVAHYQAVTWGLSPNLASDGVLMVQAGAAAALAVHVGFEGAQVLFGVAVGFAAAYGLGEWARDLDFLVPGAAVLWYQLGAIAGFLLNTVWRPLLLAVLAPLLGGFLAVVGFGVLVGRVLAPLLGVTLFFLPSPGTTWIAASSEVLGPSAGPVLCGCAVLLVLLQGYLQNTSVTVALLATSLTLTTLPGRTGLGCWLMYGGSGGDDCPEWLQPAETWWPVVGCVLWPVLTVVSARRQLEQLDDWEIHHFWQGRTSTSACARALQTIGMEADFEHERMPGPLLLTPETPLEEGPSSASVGIAGARGLPQRQPAPAEGPGFGNFRRSAAQELHRDEVDLEVRGHAWPNEVGSTNVFQRQPRGDGPMVPTPSQAQGMLEDLEVEFRRAWIQLSDFIDEITPIRPVAMCCRRPTGQRARGATASNLCNNPL